MNGLVCKIELQTTKWPALAKVFFLRGLPLPVPITVAPDYTCHCLHTLRQFLASCTVLMRAPRSTPLKKYTPCTQNPQKTISPESNLSEKKIIIFPKNSKKNPGNVRTLPNAPKCIRSHPNAPERIRTDPNTFKNVREGRKVHKHFTKLRENFANEGLTSQRRHYPGLSNPSSSSTFHVLT